MSSVSPSPASIARAANRRSRLGGLDGLRAVAVGMVVVYHLFPATLQGGFLGVDVFFVISGFLITSLLLAEHRRTGKIALGDFWQRRARRLLPALAIVLLVSTSAALLAGKELLVSIGAQLVGASFFVANWVYIALGTDYFAGEDPELFRNTWSLAIEEQFYVLLPLVLLFALRMRARATRVFFFALFGVGSALWMSTLFAQGGAATRVYFGTDTHVFGLLLGVALACALSPSASASVPTATQPRTLAPWQQLGLIVIGAAGLTALGWLSVTLREGSPESFMGGFQLATVAVLAVVWAATREGAWLGRALDVQPLRWIGERSYGIYLWHWPLLLIIATLDARVDSAPWVVPAATLILTLGLAALSYRYVEQPIRRLGLRRSLAQVLRPVRLRGRSLAVGFSLIAVVLVTVPAAGYAISIAPAPSTSSEVVSRGQAALQAQGERSVRQTVPRAESEDVSSVVQDEGDGSLGPAGLGTEWATQPKFEAPKPQPVEGWEIFAVGDSVMLASAPELAAAFPDIWIDADVSRGFGVGVGIAEELAARGELRQVLVVGLGTNGPVDDADLDRLLRIAGERRIVIVNAYADRWWIPEVNQKLQAFADAHRGVTLADWQAAIPLVPGGLAGDDIHPNPSGGVAYANTVQAALDALLEKNERPKPKPTPRG